MPQDARDFISIASPQIGIEEEEAVLRVLRSGMLAQGPEVSAFEDEFAEAIGVRYAIAVSNGTAAIQVALHANGIGAGDEVLVPAFTFAATANAVLAVGATPVFVDVDDSWLIDLADLAAKVTSKSAAVIPVHLFGLMVDMNELESIAANSGLAIIEDSAQAHLAARDGRLAGAIGTGAFSLYATKNMMTGEGGMLTTDDDAIASGARLFRNHGMPKRYEHVSFGLNLRMPDLLAAIGRVQLGRLADATSARRRNADLLTVGLPNSFERPIVPDQAFHVYHQYTVTIREDRDRVFARMRELGVGADIYYPTPVHHQSAFASFAELADCPRSAVAATQVLSLPVHPNLAAADIDRIIDVAHQVATS